MGIFNEQSFDHPFAKGIQGAPGVGFSLTADGNYDINKKRLTNVGAPIANTDAATKKYVDDKSSGGGSSSSSSLTINSNIDMKDRYRILNLKHPVDADEPATKQYSDSKFLDRDGSRTMIGNLSMNNNKITNLKTPSSNNDAATKKYVDDNKTDGNAFLKIDGSRKMTGSLDMNNKTIKNLPNPTASDQAVNLDFLGSKVLFLDGRSAMHSDLKMGGHLITGLKAAPTNPNDATSKYYVDTTFYKRDGSNSLTGDLNIAGYRIKNLRTPRENSEVATKKYVDDTGSLFIKKDGTTAMSGNLNMNSKNIYHVIDPITDDQAANRGWVRKQIANFDHHTGDAINAKGIFDITDPSATPTTLYLQYINDGSDDDDFVFTTSAPGQPLVGWTPRANTFINKIKIQFGSNRINVDYLWFIPRDSTKSNSTYWVSGIRTGTWEISIQSAWSYDMSGVKLRTHGNSNHSPVNCQVFIGKPRAITKPLERLEINTPDIRTSGVVKSDINLDGNKITNLGNPSSAGDAANKDYVDKVAHVTTVQPSHYNDQFGYLMSSGSQWTDETNGGNSFLIDKIADLSPANGNFHNYNHKVIYYKINKDSQGGYNYKMGMNFYRLAANTDYTLCIELLNTEYQLWHKSQISVDKGSSTGLSIGNVSIRKLSHRYTNSRGQAQFMYYYRMIINFRKLSTGNRFFLHISVNIPQSGTDLAVYPRQFTGVYMIAYGIVGTFSNIDPDKVYDYHTAFDIKPTEVVYNVDINANKKVIKNIKIDPNDKSSVATMGQIEAMTKFTKNNLYRNYFEEVFDFTDASNYGLIKGASGVVFNSLISISGDSAKNIIIPNKSIDYIKKGGLDVSGYNINFSPSSGVSKYTLFIVFYHWRNRNFSLIKKNPSHSNPLLKLNYDKTNKKVNLTIHRNTQNISMPSSFSEKKIVLYIAESFSGGVTKVKLSDYSSTISMSAVNYNNNQQFVFTTEDGVLSKILFSLNFYDTDSDQYHKVILQEKLDGAYIV